MSGWGREKKLTKAGKNKAKHKEKKGKGGIAKTKRKGP